MTSNICLLDHDIINKPKHASCCRVEMLQCTHYALHVHMERSAEFLWNLFSRYISSNMKISAEFSGTYQANLAMNGLRCSSQ